MPDTSHKSATLNRNTDRINVKDNQESRWCMGSILQRQTKCKIKCILQIKMCKPTALMQLRNAVHFKRLTYGRVSGDKLLTGLFSVGKVMRRRVSWIEESAHSLRYTGASS